MSYITEEETEFKVREKTFSLTGDAFKVERLSDGEKLFEVGGSLLSLRESKTLVSADGTDLYKLTDALFSLRDRMYIHDCVADETALTLRKKRFIDIPVFGGRTLQAWKGGDDDGEPWLEIHGNLLRKSFTIKVVESGEEAATVSRKSFNLGSLLFDKDTYIVNVKPGFDAALFVFLAVAIDEHYHEEEEEKEEEEEPAEE